MRKLGEDIRMACRDSVLEAKVNLVGEPKGRWGRRRRFGFDEVLSQHNFSAWVKVSWVRGSSVDVHDFHEETGDWGLSVMGELRDTS